MYRCILAPVDGTAFGEQALPFAATIARRAGAVLHLAHVHVPPVTAVEAESAAFRDTWGEIAQEQEAGYLRELAARLAERFSIRVETRVMQGVVAEALERYAIECGAGLVVMSTHCHTGFSRLWHHGVAEHVSHELPLPVLLVRGADGGEAPDLSAEPEVGHILVPLDGTPYAEGMLEHAVALGRAFRARYTLLRVVRPETTFGAAILGQQRYESHHQLVREQTAARQYLSALAERMRSAGLEVAVHVVVSTEVAKAITDHVRATAETPGERIDLIAMEAHPHRPVSRVLTTHTTEAVLKDSPVPVLVFHPAELTITSRGEGATIPARS